MIMVDLVLSHDLKRLGPEVSVSAQVLNGKGHTFLRCDSLFTIIHCGYVWENRLCFDDTNDVETDCIFVNDYFLWSQLA